jgi:hypothetical protein
MITLCYAIALRLLSKIVDEGFITALTMLFMLTIVLDAVVFIELFAK